MIAYFNGDFLPKSDVAISPDDRGFLFADGLYEVIRSYEGKLFRADQHMARMNYGARHLHFEIVDFTYLSGVAQELLERNHLLEGDATVYLQVTRGVAKRGHSFPAQDTPLTIYAVASAFNNPSIEQGLLDGIKVISVDDQRWSRCDLKTVALTANVLANQRAHEAGAAEAIFVRDGVLIEGSHSNFMAVFDDVLVTAPASNYILNGITRRTVLELCAELDIPFEECPVFRAEIANANEAMIVGTTVEVSPVIQVDDIVIGSGCPGAISRRLQSALKKKVAEEA